MGTTIPTTAGTGRTLRSLAFAIAPAVAATYCAGEALGHWVHQLNADISDAHRRIIAGPDPVRVQALAREQMRQELTGLTVARLRVITGSRSKRLRKGDLVVAALAMSTAAA